MKIKPYFKTELAKPYQGKFLHEAGTSVIMNMLVKTKSVGDFMVMLPDPVSLNLNNAQNFIDKCEKLRERINHAKEIQVFSKKLTEQEIKASSPGRIKELDPEADIFRLLDQDKVFDYIQTSTGMVVSLVTAIESFVNLIIPHDYIHERVNRKGNKETLDKVKLVRKCSIEEKLEIIASIKNKSNIKVQGFWESFTQIKDLRNDIIHFKKMDDKIDQMWSPIVVFLFDSNLQKLFDNIVELIQYLHPDYLSIEK
ncbi:MAG: hypothetical protein RIQ72_598 [Candidatus Parcubacteria bacterium]|jgi:hypothetical protein